ncbi:UPF0149 family protein [Candidatus Palauibacter sp.]|uniref:UPF0149 family protein n=1 Tax=Candidatus Palauibacter sp. TaxID=3101350 RepID=UPI003B523A3A
MELPVPPSPSERAALEVFLSDPGRPEGTLTLIELEGFLFAVAASPFPVMPSEWIEYACGGEMPEFESVDEANDLFGILMPLYNAINADIMYRNGRLPDSVVFLGDVEDNLEPDAPLSQWSRGFAMGHFWLMDDWDEFEDDLPDDWHLALSTLILFTDRTSIEEALEAARKNVEEAARDVSLAHVILEAWCGYPHSLMVYSQEAMSIRAKVAAAAAPPQPAVRKPRPGRNEPCDCGSGRKFKKCCGELRVV